MEVERRAALIKFRADYGGMQSRGVNTLCLVRTVAVRTLFQAWTLGKCRTSDGYIVVVISHDPILGFSKVGNVSEAVRNKTLQYQSNESQWRHPQADNRLLHQVKIERVHALLLTGNPFAGLLLIVKFLHACTAP